MILLGQLPRYLCGHVLNHSSELYVLAFPPSRLCSAAGGQLSVSKNPTPNEGKPITLQGARGFNIQDVNRMWKMKIMANIVMKCS